MAAVLSNNMNDIKQVSFFMEECKRMGLKVLGPCVNESYYKFTVNNDYAVRFGMGAIKGVGSGAVETIVDNRKDGKFKSIFDLAKRIDLRAANKKAIENLALAGGFDTFDGTTRAQYFHHDDGDTITFYEKAIRYGAKFQENENSSQVSLFGEASDVQIAEPVVPPCDDWSTMEKLAKEKEVVGIYISGHPLDDFRFEMKYFCNSNLEALRNLDQHLGKSLTFAGIVNNVQHRVSQKGKGWATFTLEGYDESFEFRIFNEEYLKFRHFLIQNNFTFFKVLIKEGWTNRETGKKSDPQIQFTEAKQLQDVLTNFSKKIIIDLDIKMVLPDLIKNLSAVFAAFQGDHQVSFEILETEKAMVKSTVKRVEIETSDLEEQLETEEESDSDENLEVQNAIEITTETEEIRVLTKLAMNSRRLKVNICYELLQELEKIDLSFRLN
jgi:DNA polymerase-3 subunit alpha